MQCIPEGLFRFRFMWGFVVADNRTSDDSELVDTALLAMIVLWLDGGIVCDMNVRAVVGVLLRFCFAITRLMGTMFVVDGEVFHCIATELSSVP